MPWPGGTWVNQIADWMVRQELEQYYALVVGWLQHEHKEDGSHAAITADSITTTGNAVIGGASRTTGDVHAQYGTGNECSLGALTSVNGTALVPGEVLRYGLLLGGVTNGYFFLKKGKSGVFSGGGYELAIYDLGNTTNTPMLQIAVDGSTYSLIDGGTGSTQIQLGNANRPIAGLITNDVTVNQRIIVGAALTPSQLTADQNNYNPTGFLTARTVIQDQNAARTITGFAAGATGQRIRFINNSNFNMTLAYNSASSSVGNRMICPSSVNYTLVPAGAVHLEYQLSFWFVCEA